LPAPTSAPTVPPTRDALAIRDLKFRYPDQREGWAVDIAALSLAPGEQLLLTAGSGRGKSTLLHLIAGLLDPASGSVLVNDTNVHSLRGEKRDLFRGRSIGMIFQTFNLLPGFSAAENVMAAMMFSDIPRAEHRPRALALLKALGMDRVDADPDRLSVGQQQRVAVARAVACDPALVLADEPTASLDPENSIAAIELIQSICKQKNAALLCVSHDPTMPTRFPKQAKLDNLSKK
jgi:ABC-type lipoprotein export system ATPase subunit